MTLDDMLATWRTQDETPLYGVNKDLLQLVLQHEQAGLWRTVRLQQWVIYAASVPTLGVLGWLLSSFVRAGAAPGDVAASVVAMTVLLLGAAALWFGHRRQVRRERGFGNSLREEVARNLSLLDYQLSRIGQTRHAVLAAIPLMLASMAVIWLVDRLNPALPGWYTAVLILFVLVVCIYGAVVQSRITRKELLPRRRRLGDLLEVLNAND